MQILIITDSNGYDLNLDLLKPYHNTKIERKYKYVLSEASNEIPVVKNPNDITDIVFQVGLNDTRQGVSTKKVIENTSDMQTKYKNQFPNARQHLVALPPLDDPQIEVNQELQKLANLSKANFVTTKALRDRMTGKLRKNLMNGYHYNNDIGIKTLAREIKKSLFSDANLSNKTIAILRDIGQSVQAMGDAATS